MKKALFILPFLLVIFCAKAQYVNCKAPNALTIKNRILIVGLEEPDPSTLLYFKKDSTFLKIYIDEIAGSNYALKNAVEKFWQIHSNVQFMPLSEAKLLAKNNKDKYCILHFSEKANDWKLHSLDGNPEFDLPVVGWKLKRLMDQELSSGILASETMIF
jgi:hypothetical protein